MENILVIVIVVLAGAYIIRRYYRGSKKGLDCGCGCSSCSSETTSEDQTECHSRGLPKS
jgi:hypothetical protein